MEGRIKPGNYEASPEHTRDVREGYGSPLPDDVLGIEPDFITSSDSALHVDGYSSVTIIDGDKTARFWVTATDPEVTTGEVQP